MQLLMAEGLVHWGAQRTCVGDDAHCSKAVRLCGVGGKAKNTCTATGSPLDVYMSKLHRLLYICQDS